MKIWGAGKKRRPGVPQGKIKQVVARSKGRCESCGTKLQGLHYHIHHRNMDPTDNRESNLRVLCPNCHSNVRRHPVRGKKEPSFDEIVWGKPKRSRVKEPTIEELLFDKPKRSKAREPSFDEIVWGKPNKKKRKKSPFDLS